MRLFNSFTNQIEEFKPIEENKVKMYVCGPTVYDFAHLGHARCYITWDVLYRYLKFKGYDVTYCRNVTDVDDKILKKAEKEGKTPEEVSTYWYKAFAESMNKLNNLKPDVEPFATKTLGEMISIVKDLINKGYAYEVNGDVYFRVKKFPQYGMLSKQPIDQLESGARVEVGDVKEDALDFALWKKDEKFGYKSPWGVGRPGWHIECSAMSRKYLGDQFDIHGGGQDLIFPHHENEIAQTECVTSKPMANYWLHNGFITINSEKMSKSLGNFFLLRDILDKFDSETVRFYLLSVHYRSPLDFDDEKLQVAQKGLERMKNCYTAMMNGLKAATAENTAEGAELVQKVAAVEEAFQDAMNDDFNTALASAALFDMAREINTYLKQEVLDKAALQKAAETYTALLNIMGLDFAAADAVDDGLVDDLMNLLIDLRKQARAEKNYAMADQIRNQLNEIGVVLEDTKQGTTWKRK